MNDLRSASEPRANLKTFATLGRIYSPPTTRSGEESRLISYPCSAGARVASIASRAARKASSLVP
jgi:hypothetical protein